MAELVVWWGLVVATGLPYPLMRRSRWTASQWARYVGWLLVWPISLIYGVMWLRIKEGPHALSAGIWGWHITSMMAVPDWQWRRRLVVRQPGGLTKVWLVGDDRPVSRKL